MDFVRNSPSRKTLQVLAVRGLRNHTTIELSLSRIHMVSGLVLETYVEPKKGPWGVPDGLSAILKLSFRWLVVAQVESNLIGQSSQVQTITDYAKLSLSSDQPIILALKQLIPCYAGALCIKTHSALQSNWLFLAGWILALATAFMLSFPGKLSPARQAKEGPGRIVR